jgi:hypothetical protein
VSGRGDDRWRERREQYLIETDRAGQLLEETRNDPDEPRAAKSPAFRLKPYKPYKPKLREDDIETQCLTLLALRGWYVQRNHSGTFRSFDGRRIIKGHPKGTPDYTCCRDIHAFHLEIKRPGEKPSPDQIKRHNELRLLFRLEIVTIDSVRALDAWLTQFSEGLKPAKRKDSYPRG